MIELSSGVSYFEVLRTQTIQFINVTLQNFTYTDIYKSNSYIVRFDKKVLVTNSTGRSIFQDVVMDNCETNLLVFKGYNPSYIASPME